MHNFLTKMTKTAVVLSSLYLASAHVCLAQTSNSTGNTVDPKLRQNLDILQGILQKSLASEKNQGIGRLEHHYILGQGVFFKASAQRGYSHFLALPPLPPQAGMNEAELAEIVADAHAIAADVRVEMQFDEETFADMSEQADSLAEIAAEQQQQMREQLRDLREQKRDLERDLRDVEREKTDIEFSQKVSKLPAEQQQQLKVLNERQASLQKQITDISNKFNAKDNELKQKRAEQQKAAEQQQQALISQVGSQLAATLCDFGASLRELKEQEFVALQLSTRGREGQDFYWVINKSDINQCVSGKINATTLLKKAAFYRY